MILTMEGGGGEIGEIGGIGGIGESGRIGGIGESGIICVNLCNSWTSSAPMRNFAKKINFASPRGLIWALRMSCI